MFASFWLAREGGGGLIHRPKQHAGGAVIDIAGVDDAHDFDAVELDVAAIHDQVEPGEADEAAGPGRVVEAGAGVEMMAAAGALRTAGARQWRPSGKVWRQRRMITGCECMETSAGSNTQGRTGARGMERGKCGATLRK